MARDTKLAGTEIHIVKMQVYRETGVITLPQGVRESVNFYGGLYLGVIAMGPCVIVARLTDVTPEGAEAEMERAVGQAYKEFTQKGVSKKAKGGKSNA
jgi:hypothetical protein